MDTDAVSSALAGAAARLDLHGDALRSRVAVLARQRDAMRWQSPGGRACRARIEVLLRALLAASAQLTLVADDLTTCAARVANAP
jgi:hypothetical protein